MQKTADLIHSKFNNRSRAKLINYFCRYNHQAFASAVLAQELFHYLSNKAFLERSFYTVFDLNDYSRYAFKYLVCLHLLMLKKKLESENLGKISNYFSLYFHNVLLEPLFEEVIYPNMFFADFSNFLMQDFNSVYAMADFYFPRAPIFAKFTAEKLEKYAIAHSNYLMEMSIPQLFNEHINYGFMPKLDS